MTSVRAPRHRAAKAYDTRPELDLDQLVRDHSRLIDRCARALVRRTGVISLYDDLWSAGAIGLVDAAQRYEGPSGDEFRRFAEHRVRGSMIDELRRIDHLPRRLRARTKAVERAEAELKQLLGREPTVVEIAEHAELDEETVMQMQGLKKPLLSLDDKPDAFFAFAAGGSSNGVPDPESAAAIAERKVKLAEAIGTLPERLQILMGLRYSESCSYQEIADVLGVSAARIAQLHARAVELLRKTLSEDDT